MTPRRIGPTPEEVLVIRSGYSSHALWLAAINQALHHGRDVRAIDEAGQTVLYKTAETRHVGVEDDW